MRWLPTVAWQGWCSCGADDDGDYEGRVLIVTWGRWTAELALGRREVRG